LGDLIEQRFDEFITSCEPGAVPGLDPFPASKILKVGEDVARALTYLHDEVKMIHGDMKSANVLVFGDFDVIKLCDFGVARKIREDGTIEGEYVGTEIWSPLEIVRKQKGLPHEPITAKVDIYPYGLTLFEMISLKPPHLPTAEDAYDGDESFDEEAFEETLAECIGSRPVLPDIEFDSSYHKILALFFCCTEESPAQRPDARDVLKVFTEDELATACSKVTI
jgi:PDZ-binding kinase